MTRTWKVLLAVLIVVGLLVAVLIATTPSGSEFRWSGNKVEERQRRHSYPSHYRLKVTRRVQQLRASTPRCAHRFVATAHTWGGSQWFHEIISFDSRITWCGNGGSMRIVSVDVTPDNARFLWSYNGVVGSSQGQASGSYCGPYPQPECMFVEKHVQYSRAFQGVGQFTTPKIRWQVTATGACAIRKPSGDWEGCNR